MSTKEKFPHLWAFFDGALSANSGGRAREEHFESFTEEQMQQAERELIEFNRYGYEPDLQVAIEFTRWLGMMADSGYTVCGPTRQNVPHQPDDDQHALLAFELLNTRY